MISNIHLQASLLGKRAFPFVELTAALPVTYETWPLFCTKEDGSNPAFVAGHWHYKKSKRLGKSGRPVAESKYTMGNFVWWSVELIQDRNVLDSGHSTNHPKLQLFITQSWREHLCEDCLSNFFLAHPNSQTRMTLQLPINISMSLSTYLA